MTFSSTEHWDSRDIPVNHPPEDAKPVKAKAQLYFLKASAVKKLAHDCGKWTTSEFMTELDGLVRRTVVNACKQHNGGAKKLQGMLVRYVNGNH